MSLITARKKRTTLYLSVAGLLIMVAAVSAISARDPSGVWPRIGMIMVAVGAALWLPWRQLIPAVIIAWLVPNLGRSFVDDVALFSLYMVLELPGLAGIAFFMALTRNSLNELEHEDLLIGSGNSDMAGLNPETGLFDANQLRPALEAEVARSRRFRRTFSLMLVGMDEMRQKYDYRDEVSWKASLGATRRILRETRRNVDRVFHYKDDSFAIILPESGEKDIPGLVKRLRKLARTMRPAEGEAGGPLPVHFGATFFPECATTVEDLLRRAEVALRIAGGSTTRYQLDSAEAPELPPAETLRREGIDEMAADTPTLTPPPPPAVNNPVAAAIISEAYTDRASETTPIAESVTERVPAQELSPLGAVMASEGPEAEMPVATPKAAPEIEVPAPATEPPVPDVETHVLATEPAKPATADTPIPEWAAIIASAPESAIETPVMQVHEDAAAAETSSPAEGPDDFDALLKQMDETLKMIQSVRSKAA